MKRKIKDILAAMACFLYEKGILHNRIQVHTIDETIDELLNTEKSMVRFGDGEIVMIKGVDLMLQKAAPEIGEGLARILAWPYDDLLVTIPGIFDTLSDHHTGSSGRIIFFSAAKLMKNTVIRTEYIIRPLCRGAITLPPTEGIVTDGLQK